MKKEVLILKKILVAIAFGLAALIAMFQGRRAKRVVTRTKYGVEDT